MLNRFNNDACFLARFGQTNQLEQVLNQNPEWLFVRQQGDSLLFLAILSQNTACVELVLNRMLGFEQSQTDIRHCKDQLMQMNINIELKNLVNALSNQLDSRLARKRGASEGVDGDFSAQRSRFV